MRRTHRGLKGLVYLFAKSETVDKQFKIQRSSAVALISVRSHISLRRRKAPSKAPPGEGATTVLGPENLDLDLAQRLPTLPRI